MAPLGRPLHTLLGMRAPTPTGPRALALASVLVLVLAAAVLAYAIFARRSSNAMPAPAGTGTRFDGAPLPGAPAPAFTLRDQDGREVSLGAYRGRVVVLTFLYLGCGAPCTLIAQQIRGALDELAAAHAPEPAVLIVSADPRSDTRAGVAHLLAEVSLSGRALYLSGSPAQLRAVWRAYDVKPASAGRSVFAEYAPVLLIDARGAERVLFQSEQLTPEALSHDIATLERRRGGAG